MAVEPAERKHPRSETTGDTAGLISLKHWGEPPESLDSSPMVRSAAIDCGWGRLVFGQTFEEPAEIARILAEETKGRRDIAFYVREPHVVLAAAPQTLFLDPSHGYRLTFDRLAGDGRTRSDLHVREAIAADEAAINRLYLAWSMVPIAEGWLAEVEGRPEITVLVAEDGDAESDLIGVAMGIDHRLAINDPDNGSSLWALAVDPQAPQPGIGEALTVRLAERFRDAGRIFIDLSVMHDNAQAIALYEKLGFERIPVYSVKKKNPINERLFVGPGPEEDLNIYATVIVNEARRRGITVEIEDAEAGLFRLIHGGRSVACRESLTALTSAVAMSRCDDKALTRRLLKRAGLNLPDQIAVRDGAYARDFLARHGRVVVKPARGEQGQGVAVDLRTKPDVDAAIGRANALDDSVVMEEFVEGRDLRIVVIDGAVAAAAERRPPHVRGDGVHTIVELIEKKSRRRAAATDGESRIPLDHETERCVQAAGFRMAHVLAEGETLDVRKTANLHSGGTIHDVTASLHPALAEAAIAGAQALEIPVVGFDFIVDDPAKPGYVIIEANERPGLANHEPQPTAERFIDFLFPHTKAEPVPGP